MKIFIGGPIQFLTEDTSLLPTMKVLIESLIHEMKARGLTVYNAHLVEQFGTTTHQWNPQSIAQRDLEWMQQCDVFIALFPQCEGGGVVRTDGTHVELGWASALKKPIILVVDRMNFGQCSLLVQGLNAVASLHTISFKEVLENPSQLVETILNMSLGQ